MTQEKEGAKEGKILGMSVADFVEMRQAILDQQVPMWTAQVAEGKNPITITTISKEGEVTTKG